MYVAAIVQIAAAPLVVGWLWSALPAAAVIALFVVRTALEDRTLYRELPGYQEFTRQTRYRLVPGLW